MLVSSEWICWFLQSITVKYLIILNQKINRDLEGGVEFLAQTGSFCIPIVCTTKKRIVSQLAFIVVKFAIYSFYFHLQLFTGIVVFQVFIQFSAGTGFRVVWKGVYCMMLKSFAGGGWHCLPWFWNFCDWWDFEEGCDVDELWRSTCHFSLLQ